MKHLIYITLLMLILGCQTPQTSIATTEWKLVKMYGEDFSKLNSPITLQFSETDHNVSGFGGCNRFFGSYEQTNSTLKITGIGSTKMYCQETMAVEDKYFKALQEVQSLTLKQKTLYLLAGNEVILEFTQ
jgi:heat shock protein HslJ